MVLSIRCVFLLLSTSVAAGQGLPRDPGSVLGADSSYKTLKQYLARSVAFRNAYRLKPAAACRRDSGSLCASRSVAETAALSLATAPQAYDQRDPANTGGFVAASTALDQGECLTCTSFAVGAAVETAVALSLRKNSSNWFGIQDFHFCSTVQQGSERTCSSPWGLKEGLDAFLSVQSTGRLVTDACLPYQPNSDRPCSYLCRDTHPDMFAGHFKYTQLSGLTDVQQWLRLQGAVLSGMQIYPDFATFFEKHPDGVYPGPGAKYNVDDTYGHAIVIIGYNNAKEYWLVRNSWGTGFADRGVFKIAYGVSGIADPSTTFGLRFIPNVPPTRVQTAHLTPIATRPGCYKYSAQASDYAAKVAWVFGVSIKQLLLDNLKSITESNMWLSGRTLVVCSDRIGAMLPPQTGLDGLLQFKASIDPAGFLETWRADGGGKAQVCQWQGIMCDASGSVAAIMLPLAKLGGVLPDMVVLKPLKGLVSLVLFSNNIKGTLPPSWGSLRGLETIQLAGNMLTGSLPPEWSGMHSLAVLRLGGATDLNPTLCLGNRVTGSLPKEWAALQRLQVLALSCNMITGTLPEQWSAMSSLRELALTDNRLRGTVPMQWSKLPNLQTFAVGGVYGERCAGNQLTGTLPASWSNLKRIETLQFMCNQFNGTLPAEWAALSSLRFIHLEGNKLTGTLPRQWAALTNLAALTVGTRAGPTTCAGNMITGTLPPQWSALRQLQTISMACSKLSGTLPLEWGALNQLTGLGLYLNKLSGPLPNQWAGMVSLIRISLRSNNLEGQVPLSWSQKMKRLRLIDLRNNPRLSGCVPSAWKSRLPDPAEVQVVTEVVLKEDTNITAWC